MVAHLVIRRGSLIWLLASDVMRRQPFVICAEQLPGDMVLPHEHGAISVAGVRVFDGNAVPLHRWALIEKKLPLHVHPGFDRIGHKACAVRRHIFTAPISHDLTSIAFLKE